MDDEPAAKSTALGPPPEETPRKALFDMGASFHFSLSLVAHALFLAASALHVPPLLATSEDAARTEVAIASIHQALMAEAEPGVDERRDPPANEADGRERSESKCGAENGGGSGQHDAIGADRRYGVQGPSDNPDPHIARANELHPETRYMPWTLSSGYVDGGDERAPIAPWGRDDSLGTDPASARAGMWGREIAPAFGAPGVGIGHRRLCETCGDFARGNNLDLGLTHPAGATDTEHTFDPR